MSRMSFMLIPTLAVGIAAGAIANQALLAQTTPVKRTILQQKDLEGAEGREVVLYRADIAPGGVVGRHFHPGPELLFILQGALILEHDGHPPVILQAGESAHIPAKHIHNAKNASATEQASVMAFLVGEKGQPLATPVQ
jgi:quercetin dioxygenase-like cupin family protein